MTVVEPIGVIVKITTNCYQMFGYTSEVLEGNKSQMLMPECFGIIHDNLVQKYIENGNNYNTLINDTFTFGRNFEGFIFPLKKKIKIM